jgi:hypothetical protein
MMLYNYAIMLNLIIVCQISDEISHTWSDSHRLSLLGGWLHITAQATLMLTSPLPCCTRARALGRRVPARLRKSRHDPARMGQERGQGACRMKRGRTQKGYLQGMGDIVHGCYTCQIVSRHVWQYDSCYSFVDMLQKLERE